MVRHLFVSLVALGVISVLTGATPVSAAQAPDPGPLRVFLECAPCDAEFVRQNMTYVAWMRDRQDAELHVIARVETTGGGGRNHTLDFIGLQRHQGKADTLRYVQSPDDTQDVTRRGIGRILAVGMMRYMADTPMAGQMAISLAPPPAGAVATPQAAQIADPWDAWVFTIGANGNTNGESAQSSTNISANFSANRVTAEWKINSSVRGSYGEQKFTLPSGSEVVSISRSYGSNVLIVNSIGAHAAVGMRGNVSSSDFGNTKFAVNLEPAMEYSVFPYAESTRRSLTVTYAAGFISQKYREETIYSRMEETRPIHSLFSNYSTRQTWGNLSFGIGGQQYLHDTSLYNLNFSLNASVNIARGLSANIGGNYTMVRDQITLPKRNLTPEEVLLRQRAIATNYRYFSSFGLTYRFGSSVQSVVNPRL